MIWAPENGYNRFMFLEDESFRQKFKEECKKERKLAEIHFFSCLQC